MDNRQESINRFLGVIPLVFAVVALGVLVLAPFWAYQWYRLPFIGVFIEPHNVVSLIVGNDWPAKEAGVGDYDRIIAVDGKSTTDSKSLRAAVSRAGDEVELVFEPRAGDIYRRTVTPRQFTMGELISWFVIPYIVGAATWGIGVWAYRLSKNTKSALAFLTFTSAASVVMAAYFDMNTTQHFMLGWALGLLIAGGATIQLAFVFPRKMPFVARYPLTRFLPWLLVVLFAIPITWQIVSPVHPWAYVNTWLASYGFISVAILLLLSTLVVRVLRSDSAVIRQQSRIIVFGAALAFGPVLFTFLLPSAFGQLVRFRVEIAFPAIVILPLSVAYALVRYRMLDVDRIMGTSLTYALTAAGAVGIFYLLITLLSLLVPSEITPNDPVLVALYLLVLVVALNPIRDLMRQGIDRLFYRTRADYRRVLSHLSQELGVSPEMEHTLRMLEQEIQAALTPERVLVYLFDDKDAVYRHQGTHDDVEVLLPIENPLIEMLNRGSGGIWFPPGRSLPDELIAETATLDEMGCRVFVPLQYEGKMIGFLALGPRRSGDPYTSDDLDFLEAVAGQSSLALENVRLFANLQETLNQTLEMKNLMDDIFASMSSGVITTDVQRKVTLFNQAAERILGTPMDQVLGNPLTEVFGDMGPQLAMVTKSVLEENIPTLGKEFNPTLPGRGSLFLRMSCTPLMDAQLSTKGATVVIDDLTRQRQLEADRERIRQTFGRVVVPRVRDRLLEDASNLQLDGIRQPITVLFADIHDFTPFSERTNPEDLFEVLNSYLSLAAKAILKEEGTLDKFMGDAAMAFWNAPDEQPNHALRAVRAALAMDQAIRAHREASRLEHQLYFSIGISSGEAMVGNVGTSDLFNYTVIGDTVNYAQRLESIADTGQILLSEPTYQAITDDIIAKQLPPVKVKGKSKPAVVFELQGLRLID
ncbi:MAG: adenylate/guanylate cyclase domain-containing protein [Chloroflexota bacterium]|nr:adenylate/guanylate cyclase domain-containing protein [Chloroflexota bacterium]